MTPNIIGLLLSIILLASGISAEARTYLVSVGISDYSHFPVRISNLKLTANDARTVTDVYSKNGSLKYCQLINSEATRSRILNAVTRILGEAREYDVVVFFFSGHGYADGLCACDGKLSYDEIRKAMAKTKCRNKMMFIDACHSGGLRISGKSRQTTESSAKKANIMLFLSSRNDETSFENAKMNNGYFTTFLQKGLKGAADTDRDRKITAMELYKYVHKGVVDISEGRQHPVMWGNFNNNMPVLKW